MTPPGWLPFAVRVRPGSWRWQSLFHHLNPLLLLPPICPAPPVTNVNFNNMLHWLPAHGLQTLPPTTIMDCPFSDPALPNATAFDNTASFHLDDKNSYSHDKDDRSAPVLLAMSSVTSLVPRTPSTKIIFFRPPPINIDICKIYSQNVHGLCCRARDLEGHIIPNCERDNIKLEHLDHWI
jgi:hypothetical protein